MSQLQVNVLTMAGKAFSYNWLDKKQFMNYSGL